MGTDKSVPTSIPLEEALLEAVRSHFKEGEGEGDENFSEDSLTGAVRKAVAAAYGPDSKFNFEGIIPSDAHLDEIMVLPDPDVVFRDPRLTQKQKDAYVEEYLKQLQQLR